MDAWNQRSDFTVVVEARNSLMNLVRLTVMGSVLIVASGGGQFHHETRNDSGLSDFVD